MSKFRSTIRKLTEHLTSEDVQGMKFVCEGTIPTGRLEQVQDALSLFQALEERGKLSADNLTFLNHLLEAIGKVHLMRVLNEEGEIAPSPFVSRGPPPHAEPLDYRAILNHIATKLTEEDIRQILYLFRDFNAPRIHETLGKDAREFLLHLERRQIIATGHLDRLRWALGEVRRIDLVHFIDECDVFHRQSFGSGIVLGHLHMAPQGNAPSRGPPLQPGILSGQSSSSSQGYAGYAYARDPTAPSAFQGPQDYGLPTVGGPGTSVLPIDPQALPMDLSGPIGGLRSIPPQLPQPSPLDEGDPVHRPPRNLVLWGTSPNAPANHPRTVISEETQRWQQHYPGLPNDRQMEGRPEVVPIQDPGHSPVMGDFSPVAPQVPREGGSAQRKGPKMVAPPSEAPLNTEHRAPADISAEPQVSGPSVNASSTVLPPKVARELLQEKTAQVEALRKDRNQFPHGPPVTPSLRYEMSSKPHGLAVIILIDEVMFTPGVDAPEPPSSNVAAMDKASLSSTLGYLGYAVEMYNNLTAAEITRKMKTIADRDHMAYDSFICCIIGCGTEEGVYGCDGEVAPLQEVVASLKGSSCPTLVGKPKIFFFQLDQGDAVDEGAQTLVKSLETDAPTGETVPSEADFFFVYAAVTGYQVYSDNLGSYFIRTLTDVITEKAQLLHLADMLTEVSHRMAQMASKGGTGLQLPQVVSQLRKQVWFFK